MSILERLDKIKINLQALKYKKVLKRIEIIEKEIQDLTKSFQLEFNKINEFMGCLNEGIQILQSQLESLKNSTTYK